MVAYGQGPATPMRGVPRSKFQVCRSKIQCPKSKITSRKIASSCQRRDFRRRSSSYGETGAMTNITPSPATLMRGVQGPTTPLAWQASKVPFDRLPSARLPSTMLRADRTGRAGKVQPRLWRGRRNFRIQKPKAVVFYAKIPL